MSLDNSLKSKRGKLKSVLNKIERLKILYKNEDIKKIFNLPKTKVIRIKKIRKDKKEEKNAI